MFYSWAQRHQPTRWRLRQRQAAAGLHPPENRGAGPLRRAALRHIPHPAGVQRMRVQDPGEVIAGYDSILHVWLIKVVITGTTRRAPSSRGPSAAPSPGWPRRRW